jgi:O-antigen/teichoic acid export membrane protein
VHFFHYFFFYADIGFLNAGYKYASEYYAQGNREKEIQITGFITFILATFILLFSVVLILFAFNPQWLIKNISGTGDTHIAKGLLLTLALFSPNMVLQRMLQVIYGIRVQEYILQTILIVGKCFQNCFGLFFYWERHI